jgi:hypothetical protein
MPRACTSVARDHHGATGDAVGEAHPDADVGPQQPVRLGCAGSSKAQTPGGRTTGNYAATPNRRNHSRHAALCLATVVLIVGKLTQRDRWRAPIRGARKCEHSVAIWPIDTLSSRRYRRGGRAIFAALLGPCS